jgi:hypothetical protein
MATHWNLPVLRNPLKPLLRLTALVLLLDAAGRASGEQWYLSNGAGMILDYMPSRTAALRNAYCLSIEYISPDEIPEYLRDYCKPSYRIELHILYEHGSESRRQWIAKDDENVTRVVSAMGKPDETPTEASRPIGFIEIYDEHNLIAEEHQFSADASETVITYFYKQKVLLKAETRLKAAPPAAESAEIPAEAAESEESEEKRRNEPALVLISTDNYRYSRANALRSIERAYHQEEASSSDSETGENRLTRLTFPYLSPNSWNDEHFITPVTPYSSNFMQDIIMDTAGNQIVYTTDDRGKLLTETRQDAEGIIRGEIRNAWAGDRLESIDWKAGDDERRTEYEYDAAGDRILERNYNKGVLERTIRRENEQEIEELYMNGEVILRAVWENGRKISEERIRSSQIRGR